MDKKDLLETDDFYNDNIDRWTFLKAAHDGYRSLIDIGLLDDFENKEKYKKPGRCYGFNASRLVNELTTGFISEVPFNQDFSVLNSDISWNRFYNDCDLMNTDFDAYFNDLRETMGIFGLCGLLVTQPQGGNPAELQRKGIYPYCASFTPIDILSRRFERDPETGRPGLSYIKLRQYEPDTVLEYTKEEFRTWDISDNTDDQAYIIEEFSGTNELGEIPFIFFIGTKKPGDNFNGISLIDGIADIDASMIRSAVRVDNIEHAAAFPILVAPKEENEQLIRVGPNEILDYDPEMSNAKYYWLEPKVEQAINPILSVWAKKEAKIYEMSYLSGIIAASNSKSARSGDSFEQMFKFLHARLSKMVDSECEARRNVLRLWLKWQGKENLYSDISINHTKKFNVDDLINKIEDIMTESLILRNSKTATKELQKQVVMSGTLSGIDQDTQSNIFNEIDSGSIDNVSEDNKDEI